MRFLVTGGAGFIGSATVRHLVLDKGYDVATVDSMTYAGNINSLKSVMDLQRHRFFRVDICDSLAIRAVINEFRPDVILHLAAETHVDRSIDGPRQFLETNVMGTYSLLEAARNYWLSLEGVERDRFRFHHVSTDEVYGDLAPDDPAFHEETPYRPSSPYSASKAASDHLVRAWHRSYGLPVLVTNCSNNYGEHQFPEKLIPHMILNALKGAQLPVYGDGLQCRDWLHVDDHARALVLVAERGIPGETFNIGGNAERRNIDVVRSICTLLDELQPREDGQPYETLITHVRDRPGHDHRYAIDSSKMKVKLGWAPQEDFESGLRKTVQWYLDNPDWWGAILDGSYRLARLGAGA